MPPGLTWTRYPQVGKIKAWARSPGTLGDLPGATHVGRHRGGAAGTPSVSSAGCTGAAPVGRRSGSPGHTVVGTAARRPCPGLRCVRTGRPRQPHPPH